jgi:hypothetical protein
MSGKRPLERMAPLASRGSPESIGSVEPGFIIQQSSMLTYW